MEKTYIPPIRKIVIGENPTSNQVLNFTVGQKVNAGKEQVEIVEIEADENSFYFFGSIRYCIYVKKNNGDTVMWKYFENMPITVECSI